MLTCFVLSSDPGRSGPTQGGGGGLDPLIEMAVPFDQRPVNEYAALRVSPCLLLSLAPFT